MTGKDLVNAQVDALNRHDVAALIAKYAPDAVVADPFYDEPLTGRADIEKDYADTLRAFPDIHQTVSSFVESGDLIACEITVTGTNDGPLATPEGEIPASGQAFELTGAWFARLNADGMIVDERRYYDAAGLVAQLVAT